MCWPGFAVQWWMRDDLSWDGGMVVISVFGGLLGTGALDQRTKRLELKRWELGAPSSVSKSEWKEARARARSLITPQGRKVSDTTFHDR